MYQVERYLNDLSLWEYGVAIALGVLFVYQLYFYIRYMAAVSRRQRYLKRHPQTECSPLPGVSVIVAARNEEHNLSEYLYNLLEQDYPEYEVIVVNDGSEDNTQTILEEYRLKYPRLHVTFVPSEARVNSSKKLALTLAIKAAQYEYLLLTDADCVPETKNWIRTMVQGFAGGEQTQIVLGYSPYFPMANRVNAILRYDTLFNGLQYMGRAMAGHPYMGVGRNMMYRKSMFLSHKGFAGLLQMRSGDDDLFVNKVATKSNTAVVCLPDSLCWSLPKTTYKEWIIQKRRHLSVSPYYKQSSRIMLGIEPMTRGIWYILLIVSWVWGSAWLGALAWLLCVIRLSVQVGIINKAARKLGEQTFGLEVLWYDIWLPLWTFYLLSTQPKNQHNRW